MTEDPRAKARKRHTRKFQEKAAEKLSKQTVSYLFSPSSIGNGDTVPKAGKPPYKKEKKDDKEIDVILDGKKVIDVNLDGKKVLILVDPNSDQITNLWDSNENLNIDVVRACLTKLSETPVVEPKAGGATEGPYYERMKPATAIDRLFRAMAMDDKKDPPYVPPTDVVREVHKAVNDSIRAENEQILSQRRAALEATQPKNRGTSIFGKKSKDEISSAPKDASAGPS